MRSAYRLGDGYSYIPGAHSLRVPRIAFKALASTKNPELLPIIKVQPRAVKTQIGPKRVISHTKNVLPNRLQLPIR
jgi:hypothetical protein